MKKSERVLAALELGDVDRIPIYDLIRNDAAIEYYSKKKLNIHDPKDTVWSAYENFVDATKSNIRLPSIEGKEIIIDGEKYLTKKWTNWKIKQKTYSYANIEEKILKKIESLKSERSEIRSNVENYLKDYSEKLKNFKEIVVFHNAPKYGGGLYYSYNFCGGIDSFTYLSADNEDLSKELIDQCFLTSVAYVKNMPKEYCPTAVIIPEDIAFNTGTLFSPDYLKETLFPNLKTLVNLYMERGIKVIFHSDGDLRKVMDLIVDAGFIGIHPIEVIAGMNIKELRSSYPNLVLLGGVDCSQLLPNGKPEEVYSAVKKNIQDAQYGYFVGSSSEINNEIPLENIMAMQEAVNT